MIIDAHAHLTKRPLYDRGTKERLLASMEEAGVAMTFLMGESLSNSLWFGTKELLDEVKDIENVRVIAGIDADGDIPAQVEEYGKRIAAGEIVGFKLYPGYQYFYPADERLEPVYAAAARLKVPVTIHTGDLFTEGASQPPLLKYSHPLNVDEAAALHPDVTFIIAHLGNPWMLDAAEVIYKNPNVYADLSGLFDEEIDAADGARVHARIDEAIALIGDAQRFLFGTDWPIIAHEEYIAFFKRIIPQEDQAAFFHGNAQRLFRPKG